ncbi:MAG TPA: Gfo/Idh/MocA family oxidoreductase [Thermoanaerobaculia bacterium]|nr:Gfo/Idh/MocA family oxidoreductase [Thermoanaerobaculia bacterium]
MLRIAVIGAGRWGPNLVRNFHDRAESEVMLVVDSDAEKLQPVRVRFPDVRTSTAFDDVLQDARIDAVAIATPAATHYALAKACLHAGKHVLVEKPMTTNTREGRELAQLSAARGLVLMVGHVFVYNDAVRRARQYIRDRALGNLFYIAMTRTNLGPIRGDVNVAWDLAAHDISIANYWLAADPVSVSASGRSWISPGVEDAIFATLHYPENVLVHLHCSWLHPRKSREVAVVGDRAMLVFDDLELAEPIRIYDSVMPEERYIDSFASYKMAVREGDIVIPRVPGGEPLRNQCDHFLQCIAQKKTPLTGAREGLAVVRALEAVERSLRSGGGEVPVAAE